MVWKLFDSSDILEGWVSLFYNFYMEVFLIVLAIFQLYWTLPIGWRFHCGRSQIVGICGRTGWASVWRWRDRFGFSHAVVIDPESDSGRWFFGGSSERISQHVGHHEGMCALTWCNFLSPWCVNHWKNQKKNVRTLTYNVLRVELRF